LTNESSVEQFFVIRLLSDLGYKDKYIETKKSLEELVISSGGSKSEKYKPDYALIVRNKPRIIIEVKDANEELDKWLYQPSGYALRINQKSKDKSVKYFILTNGVSLKLYEWDSDKPVIVLSFKDFDDRNQKYAKLKETISYSKIYEIKSIPSVKKEEFDFSKPDLNELEGIFRKCHNLIWKKEKIKPTEAFYEFAKLFFVKLSSDKLIRKKRKENKEITPEDFVFSVDWIEDREEENITNPVNSILFAELVKELEEKIKRKEKKRIFSENEKLNMKPSTIKEVVRLLEHYDLFGIDEDLNGRMFETFLSATIKGKDLGQFFTPRTVVKFMTKLAELKINDEHIDRVLDACCGTGGFLIETMTDMFHKIDNKPLSDLEKQKLKDKVIGEYLWGVDADKGHLKISRIARMNMFLHGDGSNKIYWFPDSLDKKMNIEEEDQELRLEAEELKSKIEEGLLFDVVLTNPPFAMRYEAKKADEKKLLEVYEIAYKYGKDNSKKMKASLKSNVLFLERYRDLLESHGKLITVIDESVLNTDTEKDFRNWIKKNFIIKAIISLPRNTFVNADANVKTSILYLIKKEKEDEKQPDIFMAISENVGHNDSGKSTPELNDLNEILEEFKKWKNGNSK
jgi:type I restriction enzyme M protein